VPGKRRCIERENAIDVERRVPGLVEMRVLVDLTGSNFCKDHKGEEVFWGKEMAG
jgi:hypothetical protein